MRGGCGEGGVGPSPVNNMEVEFYSIDHPEAESSPSLEDLEQ